MKIKFRFREINKRLGLDKIRTKTIEINNAKNEFDVDAVLREFRSEIKKFTDAGSTIKVQTYTKGTREFQIKE